jgi:hypothetical protein
MNCIYIIFHSIGVALVIFKKPMEKYRFLQNGPTGYIFQLGKSLVFNNTHHKIKSARKPNHIQNFVSQYRFHASSKIKTGN